MNDVVEQVEKFRDFIETNYREQINQAILSDKKFLVIDFSFLMKYDHELANQLLDEPEETVKAFELSLENFEIDKPLRIRFFNLPPNQKIKIKDVRSEHLGQFLVIEGIVRQASDVRPQVTSAKFECPGCGNSISILQLDAKFKEPYRCTCGKKGRFRLLSKELVDAQRLVLEESPDSLQGGEQPKRLSIFLKEDLVEPIMERKTTPGSKVRVNGIVKEVPILLKTGAASTKYDLMMDSNFIEPLEETFEELIIDKEEEEKIIALSKNPKIYDKFIGSIAPSIYGHADIKEALVLQLMGGVRKERKDGTWNRGDIHILLVGDPGSSKCLKSDTKVVLRDGSINKIKDLVDENLSNFENCDDGVFNKTNFSLPSLGFDYRNYIGLCNAVWKRKSPEFLYKIITETGNEITVSPTHPMFLTENGIVFSKKSEELKKGDFIASPRNLKLNTEFQKIDFDIERTPAHNGTHIKIPKFCNSELARLIGYLTSETYMDYTETTGRTAFTNEDKILLNDYIFLVKKLFNIEPRFKKHRKGKTACELNVSSIEFLRFFEKIEPSLIMRAKYKQVPKIIQKSPNSIVKEFLKSYFDGEATVVEDKREIRASSASKDLIYDLKTLLLRFNIISQTHKTMACATNTIAKIKRPYWILTISGKEVLKYSSKIGFNSPEKQRKLNISLSNFDKDFNTNIDVIPGLPKILKLIRKKLKLTQFEIGIPRSTYQHFERGDRNPSRNSLRKILTAVSERYSYLISILKKQEFDSKKLREDMYISQLTLANSVNCSQTLISQYELEKIRPVQQSYINESLLNLIKGIVNDLALKQGILNLYYLAYSSIFWDKIQSVEKIKSEEEFVYDLTIDKVHNFVANNFYCHNSSLLMYMSKVAPKARYVSGKSASAAGLCVAPDSLVMKNPGSIVKIKDEVENNLKNGSSVYSDGILIAKNKTSQKVYTLNDDLKIKGQYIDSFWKIKAPKKMISIKLKSGKEISITKNTKLLTMCNNGLIWNKSINFKKGDFLATARQINATINNEIPTISLISRNPTVYGVKNFLKNLLQNVNKRELAKELNVNENNLYHNWIKEGVRGNISLNDFRKILTNFNIPEKQIVSHIDALALYKGKTIKIPKYLNEDLLYFAGLIAGDGDLSEEKHSVKVRLANNNNVLMNRFRKLSKKLFGVNCYLESKKSEERAGSYGFCSLIVSEILNKLGTPISPKSHKIDMSNLLLNLPNNLVASFIAGYFDCDGDAVERDKNKGSCIIEISSSSKIILKKINLVLLRWGILSRVRRKKKDKNPSVKSTGKIIKAKHSKYILTIFGKENFVKFKENIKIRHPSKIRKLNRIINKINKYSTNVDVIPNSTNFIKHLKKTHGFSYPDLGFRLSKSNLSRNKFSKTIPHIIDLVGNSDELIFLEKVSNSDIFWDQIKDVKEIKPKYDYVYDLTVDHSHNFLVNGVVVHNTGAVVKDEFLKGWALEGGAMALANGGSILLDELDKMDEDDTSALHEGLEQQQISFSKANIQATLLTRVSALAAANPKLGRFDPYQPIAAQINLPPALINRFDLIFPMRDIPDEKLDTKIATHILDVHGNTGNIEPDIAPNLLRKYVSYAKNKIAPKLSDAAKDEIRNFYVSIRNSGGSKDEVKPIPISARQLEALIRLSEASAKVRLSTKITKDDAKRAIRILKKCLYQVGIDPQTGKLDVDVLVTGITTSQRNKIIVVREVIYEFDKNGIKTIPIDDIISVCKDKGLEENAIEEVIEKMKKEGEIFQPKVGFISKI